MISKGDNIKGYIVEDELGSGGFGTVYLVHKKSSPGRKFALKLLKPQFFRESSRREKFVNEMINMAKLYAIPSIVTIYDNIIFEDKEGEHQGIVMEHVEGESLDRFIFRHSKLVAAKAVPLFLQILDAIQHAHTLGIIHRDIKPKNIMVLTGETIEYQGYPATHPIRILDFGLAKIISDEIIEETDTMSGISPAYTPPERLIGKRIGAYTDIYAVGVTLYESLTGLPPFQIKSIQDIERIITREKPSSILTHYEHHPAALNDVVQKALAKTPEDRYRSCAEFGTALADAYPPPVPASESPPEPEFPPPNPEPSNSLPRWLLGLSFLILLIIGAVSIDKFTSYQIDNQTNSLVIKSELPSTIKEDEKQQIKKDKQNKNNSSEPKVIYHSYTVVNVDENDVLNIRTGPGVHNKIIGILKNGSKGVFIIGEKVRVGISFWANIQYQDIAGWVNSRFLNVTYHVSHLSEDDTLPVFSLPGGNSLIVERLHHNQNGISVTGKGVLIDDVFWAPVTIDNTVGFVNSRNIDFSYLITDNSQ